MLSIKKIYNFRNNLLDRFRKNPEVYILGVYACLIVFLVNKIPINPDEYLYSAVARNFAKSFSGGACFSCIDSYHTFLLPLLLSFFTFFTKIDSIVSYRIIVSIFSIGSIFLLQKLFKEIFKEAKIIPSILLLLFPGFFYYGGIVFLDNLAFLFFILLVYFIVKKKSYWKIGVVLSLVFLSKEYYIIFGGFVIGVAILWDTLIGNKEEGALWKIKFFLQSLFASFLFTVVMLFSIDVLSIFPYPNLLGTFMLELFGGSYTYVGTHVKEFLYGVSINNELSDIKMNNLESLNIISNNIISNNIIIAMKNFKEAGRYFSNIFKEIFVNLYVVPLVIYGIFSSFKNRECKDLRNRIIMLSIIFIFFAFLIRTASSGDFGFRIAFILIIPFIYFISLALNDLFENTKFNIKYLLFFSFSSIYVALWLFGIQKSISDSALANYGLAQTFLRYKLLFNFIFYGFSVVFMFSSFKMGVKKKVLLLWLIIAFIYKIGPEILNSYLMKQNSSIECGLTQSKGILLKIEKNSPNVLTNYERAYYYYADSIGMPNDIRENLPIIRPKPSVIYAQRVFELSEDNWARITNDYLCEKNIDYVFFVNDRLDNGMVAKRIATIKGIYLIDEFYKNNNLNWIIYRFDKKNCS